MERGEQGCKVARFTVGEGGAWDVGCKVQGWAVHGLGRGSRFRVGRFAVVGVLESAAFARGACWQYSGGCGLALLGRAQPAPYFLRAFAAYAVSDGWAVGRRCQ